MRLSRVFLSLLLPVLVAASVFCFPPAAAQAFFAGPMPGWQKGGQYDKLYDPAAYATLKGVLDAYEAVTPLPGMVKGLALRMTTKGGEKVLVHLGPDKYLDFLPEVIRVGDRIKVKGAFARVDGKKVFMASKIRKGEVFELKLRSTRTGSPYWDMDSTQRFEETLEQ